MKRLLLIVALVAAGLSAKAQEVFNYGFETPSSELQVGKLEYINFLAGDTRDSVSTVSHKGNNALMLQNALVAGSNWQRALKFRNLPMEPNTSYRVSFWVKGDANFTLPGATAATSNIKATMMVGEDNADVPYLAAQNKPYEYTHSGFDPNTWKKMNMVFFYTNDSIQKAYYASTKPAGTAPLKNKHFLSLSVYNPGKYYIDDVVIKKSSIRSLQYNGDVIKVDFGYAVNGVDLRKGKDYETASLPIESVKVKLNGIDLVVEAVEIQPSGFYIFLATDYLDDTAQGKLKVSFTNPVNTTVALKYTDGMRPFSWNPTFNMMVADFTDEEADLNIDLTGSSIIYFPPFLKSATPENESFDLPLTTKTYKFVYSKKVDCSTAKAVMVGTAGKINMVLSETGTSETLTFNVPNSVNLTAGDYSLTLSSIKSDKGIPADADNVLMFTLGSSGGGKSDTVFVDKFNVHTTGGVIPTGWRFYSSANGNREGGTTQGSGPRLFVFSPTGNFSKGFYFRSTTDADLAGIQYGTYANNRLHLKPGKYMIAFYYLGWKNPEKCTFTIKDTLGNIAVTKEVSSPNTAGGASGASKVISNATLHEITFIVPTETDYILEWATTGSWKEMLLGKISMISVPSTAALYKGILSSALVIANNTLVMADSTLYNGSKKTALLNTINQYKTASYTSPSEYKAAAAVVSASTKALADHKTAVDNYFTNLKLADSKLIANVNTRYNKIQTFTKLGKVLEQYAVVDLEDDAKLKMASDSLYHYATTMQNWITNGIPALTYRLNKAVVTAERLAVVGPEIQAAKDALTDNDELVASLNAKIKKYLHHNLALNLIKFGKSWEDSTLVDSLELTSFIKNPNFYTAQTVQKLDNTTFPGWVTSGLAGTGLGATASATNPVVDTHVSQFNMPTQYFEQKVTGIPAGVYNIHMKTRTGDPTANGKTLDDIKGVYYYYVVEETDTIKTNFMIAAYGLPSTPTVIKNVKIIDGTFTMGVHTGTVSGYTPSLFWGDAALYMVAKADGYTYTGLKDNQIGEAIVKEVQYFTMQGFRVSRISRGLYVVKTIYDNGTVDVKKIMIK